MLATRHLLNMRYTRVEVTDADMFVLSLVTGVEGVISSSLFAPLEWMVKKEFVTTVQYLAVQKTSWICKPPISPEQQMNPKQFQCLCLLLKGGNVPRMSGST